MISTTTIVGVLIGMFLLGVKFIFDIFRQHRPHEIDTSRRWKSPSLPGVQFLAMANLIAVLRHLDQERTRLSSQLNQVGYALTALTGSNIVRKRRMSAAAIARIRAGQKARWSKWRRAHKRH
jgi:hypothetical protein